MNKYRNIKTVIDGITFDSKREANRYAELKLLQKAGEIWHLELQPEFLIEVNGQKICKYRADFSYWLSETATHGFVVEDAKGVKTPAYRLKKKLVKAIHGVDVKEV
jgi:hypothetical protein